MYIDAITESAIVELHELFSDYDLLNQPVMKYQATQIIKRALRKLD